VTPVPVASPLIPAPLILGIGNRFRVDDGVGLAVAERLRALGFPAGEHSGEGAGLMEAWEGQDRVIIADATQSGAPPGTIRRLDAAEERLETGLFRYSSHLFGLAEAVEMARALGRLPRDLVIWGIEGGEWGFGESLTLAADQAAGEVVRRIAAEIR